MLGASAFATYGDPLAGRESEILARAYRLAEPAVHAPVDFRLDCRSGLQVLQVDHRVIADDHARIEHSCRVEQEFDLAHHVIQLIAVLSAHERRHHPTGAVLSLQRSARTEHQLDHVFSERRKPGEQLRSIEALVEQEVNVPVLRVTEDHRLLIPVPVEQAGQRFTGARQFRHGNCHVFKKGSRARRTRTRNRRIQALAHMPQIRPRARHLSQFRRKH